MAAPPGPRYAPPFLLVGVHVAIGVAGMIAFAAALVVAAPGLGGFYVQPRVLALTHLCVLGWLLPITLGALHQLVPVVFERPLWSTRVPYVGLAMFVCGAAGMIWQFWFWGVYRSSFVWHAALAASGLAIDLVHLTATIVAACRAARRLSLTGAHVLAAFAWLAVALGLGVTLAWNLWHPFLAGDPLMVLRAHAHAAALGFFGLLIMGVAYRLLEMFLLAYTQAWRAGWVALIATNAALVVLTVAFAVHGRALHLAGVAAAVVGIAAFLVQIRRLVRARTRRALDPAFHHTALSLGYLGLAVVAGAALAIAPMSGAVRDRLILAYGLVALPGFIGSIVIGQLHKILPFLVWFHRFGPYVGLAPVPTASELLPARPQRVLLVLLHAGLALLVAGVLADAPGLRLAGALVFATAAIVFAANLGVIASRKP